MEDGGTTIAYLSLKRAAQCSHAHFHAHHEHHVGRRLKIVLRSSAICMIRPIFCASSSSNKPAWDDELEALLPHKVADSSMGAWQSCVDNIGSTSFRFIILSSRDGLNTEQVAFSPWLCIVHKARTSMKDTFLASSFLFLVTSPLVIHIFF